MTCTSELRGFVVIAFLLALCTRGALADSIVIYEAAIFVGNGQELAVDDATLDAVKKEMVGFKVLRTLPEKPPTENTVVVAEAKIAEYGAVQKDNLPFRGVALEAADEKSLLDAKKVWPVIFITVNGKPFDTVQRADRVIALLAEKTKGVIHEATARRYYSLSWWKKNRLTAWTDGTPNMSALATVDFYRPREERSFRMISMGMSKFGLPELVVNDMPNSGAIAMGSTINLAMQVIAENGLPTLKPREKGRPAGMLALDVEKVRHAASRKSQKDGLLANAKGKIEVAVAPADRLEGDPDAELLELTFENFPGKSPAERQNAALTQLYGFTDTYAKIKHDDELLAASQRAREKLPEIRKRFLAGLPINQRLLVKGPFKTTAGGNEWMWVEVTKWPENEIQGLLMNDPVDVPELTAGASVTVKPADVFDYLLYEGRKIVEGGETVTIMQKQMEKK